MKRVISRRRVIDIFSLAALAGLLVLVYLYFPGRSSAASFDEFPVGQERIVEFDGDPEAFAGMTPREELEQMRDWLVYTVVSSSGLSVKEASEITFDLPTVRRAYLHPVARFDYGKTRSAYLGHGAVVALIAPGDSKTQTDDLARIADEHRKNLGELPDEIVVLEYVINLDDAGYSHLAKVTRRKTIDAKELFTEQAGYHEESIYDLDSLKRFLQSIDMVTYATAQEGLRLGGRKLQSEAYRGISAEDIAAIWQSAEQVHLNLTRYEPMLNKFNDRWSKKRYGSTAERDALIADREREKGELDAKIAKDMKERGASVGSGFSLDPTYDFPALKEHFDKVLAPKIKGFKIVSDEKILQASESLGGPHPDEAPLLEILYELSKDKNGIPVPPKAQKDPKVAEMIEALKSLLSVVTKQWANVVFEDLRNKFAFQQARYDGSLQSTEVGMVLFYTDLLAKLWISDRFNSTPSRDISGFVSQLEIQVSPLFKQDLAAHSRTRLWFGKQDRSFQAANGGNELLLDHITTRVYAAGSSTLQPGKESGANIVAATFLEWWDSHYEEIARFEPQYQRLNEIMRWSLLIGWLHQKEHGNKLGFLKDVNVYRGYWFPEWAKNQPDLRFNKWDDDCPSRIGLYETEKHSAVCFYPRGYKGARTEALPLLKARDYERFGTTTSYSGGVSLADEEAFVAREALSADSEVSLLLRRADLNYAARESGSVLRTFEGASYRFNSVDAERSIVSAVAKDGTKLRSVVTELQGSPTLENTFTRGASGLKIESQAGGIRTGSLEISSSGNGFRIGYTSRELDSAQGLARQMSLAENPESVLASNSRVERYVSLPEEGGHFIKLKDAEKWVKVERAQVGSKSEVGARIGNTGSNAREYDLSWVKAEEVPSGYEVKVNPTDRVPVLENKQYEMLLDDTVRQSVAKHLEDGIRETSELLRNNKYGEALGRIDDLIRIHGAQPELKTLRSLIRLSERAPGFRSPLEEAIRIRVTRQTNWVDEVNARIPESVRLVTDGTRVSSTFKASTLSDVTRVAPGEINSRAIILVEDTPGLNNLDWDVNIIRSVQQAVDLRIGDLYRVSRLNIAEFRPSTVMAPQIGKAGAPLGPIALYLAHYLSSLWQTDDALEDGHSDEDREPEIYILSARGHAVRR